MVKGCPYFSLGINYFLYTTLNIEIPFEVDGSLRRIARITIRFSLIETFLEKSNNSNKK
jgi:hypothetical protein